MNTLEKRLLVEMEINAYEQVLEELYKEHQKIVRNCNHEINIENLEMIEYFPHYLERRSYCLLCGKEHTGSRFFWNEHLNKKSTIVMMEYPCLSERWKKNYRSKVEELYLSIKRSSSDTSEREIFFRLKSKLEELENDLCEEE